MSSKRTAVPLTAGAEATRALLLKWEQQSPMEKGQIEILAEIAHLTSERPLPSVCFNRQTRCLSIWRLEWLSKSGWLWERRTVWTALWKGQYLIWVDDNREMNLLMLWKIAFSTNIRDCWRCWEWKNRERGRFVESGRRLFFFWSFYPSSRFIIPLFDIIGYYIPWRSEI